MQVLSKLSMEKNQTVVVMYDLSCLDFERQSPRDMKSIFPSRTAALHLHQALFLSESEEGEKTLHGFEGTLHSTFCLQLLEEASKAKGEFVFGGLALAAVASSGWLDYSHFCCKHKGASLAQLQSIALPISNKLAF